MAEPSQESLALVKELDAILESPLNGARREAARRIDEHVAERTAAIAAKWKAIEQETHNGSTLRFNMLMERGGEWQPIETAPKDGPLLLYGLMGPTEMLRFNGPIVTSGYYWDSIDGWYSTASTWVGPFVEPSHWMPLPEPPQ